MIAVSVVIPTHNRSGPLRRCLEALGRQTLPAPAFEVIVVVDGATDDTREMLARLCVPYHLTVIWQERSGPGAARNRGIARARGRYCLFIDDDIVADPAMIAAHLRTQRAEGGVLVLGHLDTDILPTADGFARCLAKWIADKYAQLQRGERLPSFTDCASGNLSAPREALLAVGGFAIDLPRYEDIELGYRLSRHGLVIKYAADACGREEFRKGFQQIADDAEGSGVASVQLYHRHPAVLPALQLGAFVAPRLRVVLLRRLLLGLNVHPRRLRPVGHLFGRRPQAGSWYSFLYDYCYWRGVYRAAASRDLWQQLTSGTTILQYHAFGSAMERPSRFVVPAYRFARQMAWLRRRYRVLSLETYLRSRRECRLPPAKAVVVTIDDGYADSQALAYPILRRQGIPATIFLVSGAVGACNSWDRAGELAGRPVLSGPDLVEMGAGGIDYGAHTQTHPRLTAVPAERLREEVVGGRRDLERVLGRAVTTFAYPYGDHNSYSEAIVAAAGFAGACGTEPGANASATPLYVARRTEVRGTDSLLRFALTLWLGDLPRYFDRTGMRDQGGR